MPYKYRKLKLPDGSTIDEHRHVMQEHLGRKLTRNEVVHHINDRPRDNRIENLQLMSRAEHAQLHHGRGDLYVVRGVPGCAPSFRGEQAPNAKLNEAKVRDICLRVAGGESRRAVARGYDLAHSTVARIVRGERWKHIVSMPV